MSPAQSSIRASLPSPLPPRSPGSSLTRLALLPALLSTRGGHSPALGPNGLHPSPAALAATTDLSQVYLSGPQA